MATLGVHEDASGLCNNLVFVIFFLLIISLVEDKKEIDFEKSKK